MAWDVLSGAAKMAWDVLSGVTKTAWDVLCGVAKTAWDVLSGWQIDAGCFVRGVKNGMGCFVLGCFVLHSFFFCKTKCKHFWYVGVCLCSVSLPHGAVGWSAISQSILLVTVLAEWNFPPLSIGPIHFRFKGCWVEYFIFMQFLIEHSVNKQWIP